MIFDGRKRENMITAVERIHRGDVVAFPTETVYGLGADAFNEKALQKIFEIKNRPTQDPLILHIADEAQLDSIVKEIPPIGQKLMKKFWPGPLTLIFKKADAVPDLVTAGLHTVAVRMPRNIIATALIKNAGTVIAAPSANKFQGLSPTTAQAVEDQLGDRLDFILDGGPCLIGLESTIVSVVGTPTVLRLGGLSLEDLEEATGEKLQVIENKFTESEALPAPGLMEFHYAPKKPLKLVSADDFTSELKGQSFQGKAVVCFSQEQSEKLKNMGATDIFVLSESGNLDEAARNYFETLRKIDHSDFKEIICIKVPEKFLGRAINDRLSKGQHR